MRDRWIVEAPRTLDAMTFMNYAQYDDFGQRLDLSEDYRAIRWMQDNVEGSPVIVEANCVEYHWCTRFTIYTGLPGVVGWNWHQRQQRGLMSTWVEDRVAEVGNFYNSVDVEYARDFLNKYGVSYIIVGPMERAAYTPEGIAKFRQFAGTILDRSLPGWGDGDLQGQSPIGKGKSHDLPYHIARAWNEARQRGDYRTDSLTTEGFIHCSTQEQVVPVAEKYYKGQGSLILLVIEPERLTADLKWEPPAEGAPPPGVAEGCALPAYLRAHQPGGGGAGLRPAVPAGREIRFSPNLKIPGQGADFSTSKSLCQAFNE